MDGRALLIADGHELKHRFPEVPSETCATEVQHLRWAFLIKRYFEVDFETYLFIYTPIYQTGTFDKLLLIYKFIQYFEMLF